MKTIMVIVTLCALTLGYTPTPAPPLDPNDVPFTYDPNQCLTEPMAALIILVGCTHIGEIKVTEPDGDPVTIVLTEDSIMVAPMPFSDVEDPNDDLGKARIYRFEWRWTPTRNHIGVHYINVRATDSFGVSDQRTMIILVKENKPPVITGCN